TCAIYTVQPGDSLSLIAMKAYGDVTKWQWIYDHNRREIGDNPDFLQPGVNLFIPHPDPITINTNYTVQPGDTLQSIAERAYCNAQSVKILFFFNKNVIGPNSQAIHPGQVLFIGEPPAGGGGNIH
ncbi:MAG TPA: LysM peptidoglycan-binding domain-containing protein, partial [Ktedonobacteraceae bacterium]|nr:LysM peptidoglycan-binding domain-containing protein [Ktedonobacteraceae bacterium]